MIRLTRCSFPLLPLSDDFPFYLVLLSFSVVLRWLGTTDCVVYQARL